MKWSEAVRPPVDTTAVTKALTQLAGSAIALRIAIERDIDVGALVPEVTYMLERIGLVRSALSVIVLGAVVKGGDK